MTALRKSLPQLEDRPPAPREHRRNALAAVSAGLGRANRETTAPSATIAPRWILACLAVLAVAGCGNWHYTVNAPLERYDPAHGYRFTNINAAPDSDELFIVLTFSGGGMRASALAYGVLERLAAERVTWNGRSRRLLDEVDIINAVSGGSITAAYYALHGDGLFRDFDSRYFALDLQNQIESRIIAMSAIPRLISPRYGRVDMMQEFLDEVLFDGKTYADLARRRPFVIISASDMGLGSRFEFTQDFFDLICSDLDKFPISRAVAASSALPVALSPVTLWNYADKCSPALPQFPRAEGPLAARQAQREREVASYLDRSKRPYIHLLDGGLSDNIGMRGMIEAVALMGGFDSGLRSVRADSHTKMAIIMVNAETMADHSVDQSADVPSLSQVTRALVDVPINRYSYDTEVFSTQSLETWRGRRVESGRPLDLYLINVNLKAVADPAERHFLNKIPTSLQLPRETIDRIRAAASRLLDESPDFRRLLDSLR